jgi:hypothetical protein
MNVRHIVFNHSLRNIAEICTEQEKDSYVLVRIVPYTQYESVAVFVIHTSLPGFSMWYPLQPQVTAVDPAVPPFDWSVSYGQ